MTTAPLTIHIVSTTDPDADFGGAAWPQHDGTAIGYHLTDAPDRIIAYLQSGRSLVAGRASGKYGELGRGLYLSGHPQLWVGRGAKKFEALTRLSRPQRMILAVAIARHPHVDRHYLTTGEIRLLRERLHTFVRSGRVEGILALTGQPWNIRFWEQNFLAPLGIEQPYDEQMLVVRFRGRFARVTGAITDEDARFLQRKRVDGAFLPIGWFNVPQLVLWRRRSIIDAAVTSYTRS